MGYLILMMGGIKLNSEIVIHIELYDLCAQKQDSFKVVIGFECFCGCWGWESVILESTDDSRSTRKWETY